MKKFVLLMALCVVLFGAVTTVTGCGKKPRNADLLKVNSTVWKEKLPDGNPQRYLCFHSDGHLYVAEEDHAGEEDFKKIDKGTYSIDSEKVTINKNNDSISSSYSLKGGELKIKENSDFPKPFTKVDTPTAAQVKAYADKL